MPGAAETRSKLLVDASGAPRDRIVGFETEYGFSYTSPYAGSMYLPESQTSNFRLLQRALGDTGEFLETGERTYVDVGIHPEYATAEDVVFQDAAYRLLHGHVKVAAMISATQEVLVADKYIPPGTPNLFANTLSPARGGQRGQTWGCHENYLTRRNLRLSDFGPALLAHNASRIVWSGSGAVQPIRGVDDYRFELSEKAPYMMTDYSESTMCDRALVNTRDEPLADSMEYRRIHNIAGESVFSPRINALRLASASIVLRACELGVSFNDLQPFSSPRAMRQISADPSLQATVLLVDGRTITGLQLQQAIAERAIKAALKADYLTEQEQRFATDWQELLADLQTDPRACGRSCDWVLKQAAVRREVAAKQGSADESVVSIATSKAINYHRLLPNEGFGMQYLRKGTFRDSPPAEILAGGLPLPATRARIRGAAIAWAVRNNIHFGVDWDGFAVAQYPYGRLTVRLDDPFATENERLTALMAS